MNVCPYYVVKMNVPFLSSVSDDFYNGYIMGLSDAAGFTKEQALKLFIMVRMLLLFIVRLIQVDLIE